MTDIVRRRNAVPSLDPWRMMEDMERRMWDWMSAPGGLAPLGRLAGEARPYGPPVDIYETPDHVLVAASLPGIDPGKVDVQFQSGSVTISGEQRAEFAGNAENVVTHMRGIPRFGSFGFTFTLPCDVVSDRAEARYQDGILRISFPKAQHARPQRIAVDVTGSAPAIAVQEQIEGEQEGK
ncbi:MAG TPA: Hsp20/alpha crystallin family protein [Chthonomonadales bacterium]|nr:Hsp20/alpha crystallin family protein [Chthonomonadales bacterium]